MAEAIKLLSKGVISVCKPSLDCDVPKEVDTKRSQEDADHSIIEIIDDLSCASGNSVIIDEPNQIPITVESEDDETPSIPKKEICNSINKSTMTENFLSPKPEFEQKIDIKPLFKDIKNKTPDSFSSRGTQINKTELERSCSTISIQCTMDPETITRTASNSRLQINSNFPNVLKKKSSAQLSKLLDYIIMFDIILYLFKR